MRALLISHLYPPHGTTGVERYTKTLAAELAAAGDTVGVLTRYPYGERVEVVRERLPNDVSLYRLYGAEVPEDRFLANHGRLEPQVTRVLLEAEPDIVHINHLRYHPPRVVEMARRLGAAVVLTLHDFYFACPMLHLRKPSGEICRGPDGGLECARTCFAREDERAILRWTLRQAYYRHLLRLAAQVICPSRYVAAFFEQFGVDPERLHVIPNGLWVPKPEEVADTPPGKPGTLSLVYLGALVTHKGLHVLLEALALAKLPAVRLVVAGPAADPSYAGKARGLAGSIPGLSVDWQGPYEPAEIGRLLSGADCAIVPSLCPETFCMVAREALAWGLPILTTRLGALPELVVEGENGFTFAHDRAEELAGLLRRLAIENGLLEHLKQGARRVPFFGVAEHAAAVRQIYEAAVRETRSALPLTPGAMAQTAALQRALLAVGFDWDD
jgi:glycosyltransferase involved in cell wall biosynthesis